MRYVLCSVILFFLIISNSFAGAYIKNKNELIFILENSISSNKKNILNSDKDNFRNVENKLYFEYGLGYNLAINGYLKSLDLKMDFDTLTENKSSGNYFYNFGLQYNFIKINNHYLTFSFNFYDNIKTDIALHTTSSNDVFKAFEYGISYGYFFDNFLGYYNNNFINLDIKYKLLQNSYKNNFNINFAFGRKINDTSLFIFELLYSKDIFEKITSDIAKYYYRQSVILTDTAIKNKINKSLMSEYFTLKLSSITHFSDNLAFKIGIEKSFYKNNNKSYALSSGFWVFF